MDARRGIGGAWLVATAMVAASAQSCREAVPERGAPASEIAVTALTGACTTSVMNIVAHEDDDLLFIGPDLAHAIGAAGTCVRTVYLTAGDDGQDQSYWGGREVGIKAAYAQMAGVANSWTQSDAGLAGRTVPLYTLAGNSAVSVLFLRLPDGLTDGSGFESTGFESMQKLWEGGIALIHAIDGSTSYDRAGLIAALASLIGSFRPSQIRVQDFAGSFGDGDHSDHHVSAYFSQVADAQYQASHMFTGYEGYGVRSLAANVSGQDLTAKWNAFLAYAPFDSRVCQSMSDCVGSDYDAFMPRQYMVGAQHSGTGAGGSGSSGAGGSGSGGGGAGGGGAGAPPPDETNVAGTAAVTASSETPAFGQTAAKAVDGVVGGYPGDYTTEWATNGGKAGSWLRLTWGAPVTLSRIVLHDRPNVNDQITSATLAFSDGSSVNVGALPDNGVSLVIALPPVTTTSVLLTITGVAATTENIGLSEIEAWTSAAAPPPPPVVDAGAGAGGGGAGGASGGPPDAGTGGGGGGAAGGASGGAPDASPPDSGADAGATSESNLALTATATASSESPQYGQTASKAIDGVVDGYPGDYTKEWATAGAGDR
ncbi:MAG TPA: PIG-L family deacetylase, partial [Polyangia bacterium]